jgi:YVTN family beta-propeller protein
MFLHAESFGGGDHAAELYLDHTAAGAALAIEQSKRHPLTALDPLDSGSKYKEKQHMTTARNSLCRLAAPPRRAPAALSRAALVALLTLTLLPHGASAASYQIVVSNERSNDVTVISGADYSVVATIPVGKRPRGIHGSPDGKLVYVALSGTPIAAPPQLDAHGNPIFKRGGDDDDNDAESDKTADGIGIVDLAARKLKGKIFAGSDPEEFALSKDGTQIYVSNEDTKSASVVDIAKGKVEHIIPVGQEPEGVAVRPDGKQFYVTCESGGDVYVVETAGYTVVGHFKVAPRPRTVAFLPSAGIAFVPSESVGLINVIDSNKFTSIKTITLPTGARPMSLKIGSDDRYLYVSNGRAGTVSVIDVHSDEVVTNIKVGTRPWGIALSPDGRYLFTANGPSDDISVVDLKTNQEIRRVKAGKSPWSIAIVGGA